MVMFPGGNSPPPPLVCLFHNLVDLESESQNPAFISNYQLCAFLQRRTDVICYCLHPFLSLLSFLVVFSSLKTWKEIIRASRTSGGVPRSLCVRWRKWNYSMKLLPPEYGWALWKRADASQNELDDKESLRRGSLSNIHHFLIKLLEYSKGNLHLNEYQTCSCTLCLSTISYEITIMWNLIKTKLSRWMMFCELGANGSCLSGKHRICMCLLYLFFFWKT